MEIVPYRKGDIYRIIQNQIEEPMMRYAREEVLLENQSFTGVDWPIILGCAGLIHLWEGVYEVWIALDQSTKDEYKIDILKRLKNIMDNFQGIRRIHGFVNQKLPNQEHFMKFLGFEKEATLKEFFPNKFDCVVWRRLYGT